MKSIIALSALAGLSVVSAADCPAPGSTNAEGDYSCNPAHQYPEGQVCALIGDCYFLRGLGGETGTPAPTHSATATHTGPAPHQTCPPAGSTNAEGDYSCNPAHQYPEGQVCALIGECYFLRGLGLNTSTGGPAPTHTGTATHTGPAPHETCPPAGSTNAEGDYSCNPAHQYPNEVCALIGDCYYLRGLGLQTSTHGVVVPTHSDGHPLPSHSNVVVSGAAQLSSLSAAGGLVALALYAML